MVYLIGEMYYSFSYRELKEQHFKMCKMSDEKFFSLSNLIKAAHLSCMIGYLKELNRESTISDEGIVHQLIHVIDCVEHDYDFKDYGINPNEIRAQFEELLKLA